MHIVIKAQITLRSGGLKALLDRASSYLETRILIATYRLIPNAAMKLSRDSAGIKILRKQTGDLDSTAMIQFIIPKLSLLHSDSSFKAIVPTCLCNAFNLASPIMAKGQMHFFTIDEIVNDVDMILCNPSMINQMPSVYSLANNFNV